MKMKPFVENMIYVRVPDTWITTSYRGGHMHGFSHEVYLVTQEAMVAISAFNGRVCTAFDNIDRELLLDFESQEDLLAFKLAHS
jgi:hypothetical protein